MKVPRAQFRQMIWLQLPISYRPLDQCGVTGRLLSGEHMRAIVPVSNFEHWNCYCLVAGGMVERGCEGESWVLGERHWAMDGSANAVLIGRQRCECLFYTDDYTAVADRYNIFAPPQYTQHLQGWL